MDFALTDDQQNIRDAVLKSWMHAEAYALAVPSWCPRLRLAVIWPILIGLGAGADGRRPMGAVIVGGMLLATFLTLFVVPMAYDVLKRKNVTPLN